MLKIGVDVRCLVGGRRTGVEEYTLNLLKNLFELDTKNTYVLFLNSLRASKADLEWAKKYDNVSVKKFNYPNKFLNFFFWYLKWPKIDQMIGGMDVMFFPNIIFSSVSARVKTIVTIHDLSFERYPETFSWKRRLWHIFINPRKICQKATQIIAVSESTKNDLISVYGIESEKITVIYSGVSSDFEPVDRNDAGLVAAKERYKLPYKFILYFGTIEPRKNLLGIIRAYNELQNYALRKNDESLLKYHLIIAGQKGWLGLDIDSEIEKSIFRNKIMIINSIPDGDKKYIYNLATLFVYPSFFEGFGFPPLEAMRCGVPTIVSNNSSLPEVVGRGAIMIDPDKPDEIFRAMRDTLANFDLRQKLIVVGLIKTQEFQWRKTAQEFLEILKFLEK